MPPPSGRPSRMQIRNELGALQTLPTGAQQFTAIASRGAGPVILLGLGPDPAEAAALLSNLDAPSADVLWLEAPQFARAMPSSWREAIPEGWQRLNPETPPSELARLLLPAASLGRVLLYRQAPRLFPSFWAPVLAQLRWLLLAPPAGQDATTRGVMLPGDEHGLLLRELQQGFEACGIPVRRLEQMDDASLQRELADAPPALFCSVNFKGLDPFGERFELLRAAGCEVAVWCVDTPWHQLSGLKSPFWRKVRLFVTDASFIGPLRRAGAQHVEHLPLAAWPEGFDQAGAAPAADLDEGFCFVGRSCFPNKTSFFAGLRVPEAPWQEALAMLEAGLRPDFHWWQERLGLDTLWPGRQARLAGLCAEEAGRTLRQRCLTHAAELLPVQVYGDDAWPSILGEAGSRISYHKPVDYYGALPRIYAAARYTLNATSLLLPAGLTQRHFDVWTAGGFLITDATPGLEIFPQELTRPVVVDGGFGKAALANKLESLEKDPTLRRELTTAWQKELLSSHTIAHRAARMLELCGLEAP